MLSAALGSGEVQVIEAASPNDGDIGSRTLNGVNTAGQDTSTGEGAVKEGRKGPPTPAGRAICVVGVRQPVLLEKQLKGGGVFDGVGVRVEVYVATPEGDGAQEGDGGVDAVTEKLADAESDTVKAAEKESRDEAEPQGVCEESRLVDGREDGVG